MQSNLNTRASAALHVAVVMDGNGRWATRRGLPRTAGHRAGAEAVRRVVEAAPGLGIGVLTLFAFSADNWGRPRPEVAALMRLLRAYLRAETARCVENGLRVSVIGRRDRLAPSIVRAIRRVEHATRGGPRLHLRIALDYSAREAIARAALGWARAASPDLELLGRMVAQSAGDGPAVPDVDLLVRTGGERRLSDFLLWECAYAELHFTDRMWPDFEAADLAAALAEFRRRERRFGRLPDPPRAPAGAHDAASALDPRMARVLPPEPRRAPADPLGGARRARRGRATGDRALRPGVPARRAVRGPPPHALHPPACGRDRRTGLRRDDPSLHRRGAAARARPRPVPGAQCDPHAQEAVASSPRPTRAR